MIGRRAASRLAALSACLVTLVAGCGSAPEPSDTPPSRMPAVLTYRCGDLAMTLDALLSPLGAEEADDPAARALKAFLRRVREPGETLAEPSNRTFRVLAAGEDTVIFGSGTSDGPGFTALAADRRGDAWTVRALGACEPVLELRGLNAARWHLPPGGPMPAPDVQRFTALVDEVPCVGGRSAQGRVLQPAIVRRPDALLLVFAIVPDRPLAIAEPCPAAPPTTFDIDLGAPLGNRELLDAGTYPPVPAWHPDCCG